MFGGKLFKILCWVSVVIVGDVPFINLLIESDFKLKLVVYKLVVYHVYEMALKNKRHQSIE